MVEGIVRVGLAAIIRNGDYILFGKRRGSHQSETWSFPGGHIDYGETSFDKAIRREVREETSLEVGDVRFVAATNDLMPQDQKHYVTLFFEADYLGGEPRLMEPDKCYEWKWVNRREEIVGPLMTPVQNLLIQGVVEGGYSLFR